MENQTNSTFSLRDFYEVFFKHKALIIVLFFTTVITVFVGLSILPETYEARAKILIKLGRENVSLPPVVPSSQQQMVSSLGLRKEDINSEIEILQNTFIIENVVNKLGIDHLFPKASSPETFFEKLKFEFKQIFRNVKDSIYEVLYELDLKKRLSRHEMAVQAVQKCLNVEQVRNSDVISVAFRWPSPQIATEVLDALIAFYLVHHLEVHRISGGHEFFQKQVEIIGERLKSSENKLKRLKKKEGIFSYQDQRLALLNQLANLKASLKDSQTELRITWAEIEKLRKQMDALLSSISPGFDTSYKAAEKALLLQEVHLTSVTEKKLMLENHIASYQNELNKLNLYDTELKRLNRQIQINEDNYKLYRKKLEEARISEVLDNERIVNVKVIEPSLASSAPVRPRKLLIVALGIVLSLLAGIGFAFLAEYFDHSIKTAEEVSRYLELPLLASIPEEHG